MTEKMVARAAVVTPPTAVVGMVLVEIKRLRAEWCPVYIDVVLPMLSRIEYEV